VVAKRRAAVSVVAELVEEPRVVGIAAFVHTGTGERDVFVASFMDDEAADLTLVALFAESPDEILAM